MSLIHADSQAAVKPDLFLTPPTQKSIEKGQWLECHPIANIRDGNPIEFSISVSEEDYIDLSATQLSYIESLLNYGSDYKKRFLTSECFYKDSPECLDVTDPEGDNEGLKNLPLSSKSQKGKI
ncbi:hypothetical protein AVEN_259258-1 [Araneus ventricosus]|uniref:Uncharacterized protein n=1 Tax=Araneus ventricosus TaxID=182803 RepID=A0A4Y2R750_ARAVE|nr:hypothetical protein AVEN_259258-1 [Araneus ventricosus]